MTFTADPTTDRGKCRLLIFDNKDGTYLTDYQFTDADIDAALEINSDSVWFAAADLCRAFAAKFMQSGYALEISGALKIDKKEIPKFYMDLADKYEKRAGSSADAIVEIVDSYQYEVDEIGRDNSEYVD